MGSVNYRAIRFLIIIVACGFLSVVAWVSFDITQKPSGEGFVIPGSS